MDLKFIFPWPPSVNHYWGQRGKIRFVDMAGKQYRKDVWILAKAVRKGQKPLTGKLSVSIAANPPDNIKRDLDNILKCILDSMQHAGVYEDDNQIDLLQIGRMKERVGQVEVTVKELC